MDFLVSHSILAPLVPLGTRRAVCRSELCWFLKFWRDFEKSRLFHGFWMKLYLHENILTPQRCHRMRRPGSTGHYNAGGSAARRTIRYGAPVKFPGLPKLYLQAFQIILAGSPKYTYRALKIYLQVVKFYQSARTCTAYPPRTSPTALRKLLPEPTYRPPNHQTLAG